VRVLQRLKSLRGILVRNYGFSESDFFVVCEDIWIAICPFYVVVVGGSFHLENPGFIDPIDALVIVDEDSNDFK
jgi:hypothetical protein